MAQFGCGTWRRTPRSPPSKGHADWVRSVSFSPDGTTLASGSGNAILLWDVATHTTIATLQGHTAGVVSVSFSPDGATLASGSRDGTILLWDVATHTTIATLQGHTDQVLSVSFSPDGATLASGSRDGTVKAMGHGDAHHYRHTPRAYGGPVGIVCVGWGHLGFWITGWLGQAMGCGVQRNHHYARRTCGWGQFGVIFARWGHPGFGVIRWHGEAVGRGDAHIYCHARRACVWGLFGIVFARWNYPGWGSYDGTVKLWDVATHTPIATLEGHAFGVSSVSFSPDGAILASGRWDGTILLWDVAEWTNAGKAVAANKLIGLPDKLQLQQNAPNPFNSQTVLSYFLPKSGPVRLELFFSDRAAGGDPAPRTTAGRLPPTPLESPRRRRAPLGQRHLFLPTGNNQRNLDA